MMAKYTAQLSGNKKLRKKLETALERKNPFSGFKYVIDTSGEYRQQWFDFKNALLKQWVKDTFEKAVNENDG